MHVDVTERERLAGLGAPRLGEVAHGEIALEVDALIRLHFGRVGTVIEKLSEISHRQRRQISGAADMIAVIVRDDDDVEHGNLLLLDRAREIRLKVSGRPVSYSMASPVGAI